ncbi:putative F420-dependent oxidoreductase [Frankia sp. AiPs1]|uniref:TIGR03619 family F420-dependent LLM class oxidoreductase n=1 Tax=Frankia sp. AiPa1 TaxID=573492 RepID=UPI00202AC50B|nr:TIGR03619 family F420-dependent LLM class oxidoreductase [Frankia sp. AiPa1]MCL9761306.1 TIGR03619 family F420-dependent LLM class oxidoreductase [Frankia sp. AiPa1]
MELGVHGVNISVAATGADTARLARRAEQLGYGSWWTGDHVVMPASAPQDGPNGPADPIVDSLVHLSYVAAVTERLRLGTGILILPQRNPLVLAKQAASLDALSGGRLLLGVGPGWQAAEMRAVGVDPTQRGARTDEYLDAMTSLWTDEAPEFHGRYVDFADVIAAPRPVTPGGPPIIIGGQSPAALRRAVGRGHGWFFAGTVDGLVEGLRGLEKAAGEVDRPARLGRLEITFMNANPADISADTARQVADLGVDRFLVFATPSRTADAAERFLERHADLPR